VPWWLRPDGNTEERADSASVANDDDDDKLVER